MTNPLRPFAAPSATSPRISALAAAHAHWLACRPAAEMPSWMALNTEALDPLRAQSILFEVMGEPLDFRYAEIGEDIQAISLGRYTGKRVSELPHQRPPSKVWDHLAAAVDARAPVQGILPYVGRHNTLASICHIVLPLADDGETVDRLLVCVDLRPQMRL